jgi:CubicO group peptidase (beta-lactamase class C family)
MLLAELQSLRDPDQLMRWLADAAANAGKGPVSIGVLAGGQLHFAGVRGADACPTDGTESVTLGCLAKLLTTAAALEYFGDPAAWRLASVGDLLSVGAAPCLADLRLDQLANHTHGLDDSALRRLPLGTDGRIDTAALCSAFAGARRLSAAGALHSYGNAGPWLWAALLERRSGRPFAELFREFVAGRLGLTSLQFEDDDLCPASGASLRLSVADLLRFVRLHIDSDRAESLRRLLLDPVPLPGWTPAERWACQGWKGYGAGWFGHNAVLGEHAALLRFNVDLGIGIVGAGDRARTFATFMRLFARALPEFTAFRPLRSLAGPALSTVNFAACEGSYRTGAMDLVVRRAAPEKLECGVRELAAAGSAATLLPLRCASEYVFFPEQAHGYDLPFLQFIQPAADGFGYLWNGKSVWPRVAP